MRAGKAEERGAKFDQRLEATRKLVEAGMKMMVRMNSQMQEISNGQKLILKTSCRAAATATALTELATFRFVHLFQSVRFRGIALQHANRISGAEAGQAQTCGYAEARCFWFAQQFAQILTAILALQEASRSEPLRPRRE